MPRPTLKQIFVHPLKSGRGQAVEQWPLGPTGLVLDRGLMLVDAMGRFVTLRGVPRMVLIQASPFPSDVAMRFPHHMGDGNACDVIASLGAAPASTVSSGSCSADPTDPATALRGPSQPFPPDASGFTFEVLDRPELGPLPVDLHSPPTGQVEVEIWGEWVMADRLSAQADTWFSAAIGQPVSLVRLPAERARQVDPRYAALGDLVSLADGFPLLVTTTASLESLSRDLGEAVPMERFRPNLVLETDEPWVEDRWRRIRIGAIELELVKPCARCVGVNVDPLTGKTSREPLKTLARSRTRDGKVYFGQNAIHRGVGVLSVGDAVEIIDSVR